MEEDNPVAEGSAQEETEEKESSDNVVITEITCRQDLTPFFKASNQNRNKIYETEVVKLCKDEPCQLGVDEAGRGPAMGPMVYGITYSPISKKKLLNDLGCADSKSLTEDQRDQIFDKICKEKESIGWSINAISPNVISNSMYSRCKISLNELAMNATMDLIDRALKSGVNVEEIYVDTIGKPEKYQEKLKYHFPDIKKIVVAKKADATYPIVSAASICAKVCRDYAIRAWNFVEGEMKGEFGSGYPNDPLTKQWLADNIDPVFGFPRIVRFSWSTAEKILENEAVDVEWEEVDKDEDKKTSKDQKISSFFLKYASDGQVKKDRHEFFMNRRLTSTKDL